MPSERASRYVWVSRQAALSVSAAGRDWRSIMRRAVPRQCRHVRLIVCLLASVATVAVAAAGDQPEAARDANVCSSVWFPRGMRLQMEADGDMPMSRRSTQLAPLPTTSGCQTDIEIHSKTALAALMGPPVITEQQQRVLLRPAANGAPPGITGSATVNAWARYTRLYGTTTIDGLGLLDYQYRGLALHEGDVLDGGSVEASVSFTIYARDSATEVGKLVAPHATVAVASRRVGKRQLIQTALGPSECVPIQYVRVTSIGPMIIAGEQVLSEAARLQVTDWYCPAAGVVMRQDITEGDKMQRIDTTAADPLEQTSQASPWPR